MQLTKKKKKRIKKIHVSYTLKGTDLENAESISYSSRLKSKGGQGGKMIDVAMADNKTNLLFCNFSA